MKELSKVVQNLKVAVETIKKTQMEATIGKRSGTTDVQNPQNTRERRKSYRRYLRRYWHKCQRKFKTENS
jgi:FtsZ-binding cell division protein ZapB